jgi:hypothetical protein
MRTPIIKELWIPLRTSNLTPGRALHIHYVEFMLGTTLRTGDKKALLAFISSLKTAPRAIMKGRK